MPRHEPLRLLAILAHPDDESLGFGGTLAKYAAEGVETSLVTATRGQRGRYRGHRDGPEHPGADSLGAIREGELRQAAATLGIRDVAVLEYRDADLDRASPSVVVPELAEHITRVRPDVVITFGPDGVYGHADHVAVSQFTTAAIVEAASATRGHVVSKLYHMAWSQETFAAYHDAFSALGATVDGVERRPIAWPDWMLTTTIDARAHWQTVWKAIRCHESQLTSYAHLAALTAEQHQVLWGRQCFVRVFSRVNAGRTRELDLFEGLR
jgi:LmbE family N-acetylglucosaminyl deacetylase